MAKRAASANRRTDIVNAAIEVFAEIGYYRATTAQVAERAEISQPYVFRFFNKETLMVAALEVSFQRIQQAFERTIQSAGKEHLEAGLIRDYEGIMERHRNEILLQMQAQTIQEEPIREAMRKGMAEIHHIVLRAFEEAGIEQPQWRTENFMARGLLCNLTMALDLPQLMKKDLG
ncbi:TetR/AcrR family transcriptional regulator [Paenibacillus sp. alder61]|uniref:TetR/AcrR family transcriptional regulator n=1 Tax=Paenibacillus faecis TaxID=862114 RepID=A0A5D0CXX5_9BACL|nr:MULTISPECIES: TetR/AcrR family transcriptional regulator [Paenibacillus]MCA1296681.1 TetR/AcrR family transcriptional regulator [Paenibacillus sp. alder61]TYA14114.1 TetR/AcrR family transcriptional regulator [Paenibacillus faecis]